MTPPREARLKSEFAALYPDLASGVWLLGTHVADRLALLARRDPEFDVLRRVVDERHFEFRGGPPVGAPHVVRDRATRGRPGGSRQPNGLG